MDLPASRRFLDKKPCRYEPHVLLVPLQANLTVRDSDPVLHTVQMSGSADYNLPFVVAGAEGARPPTPPGAGSIRGNGNVWGDAKNMAGGKTPNEGTAEDGSI